MMPEIELAARGKGWVRPGIGDPALLEIVRMVHWGLITPAEADVRLASHKCFTSIAQFRERVETEAPGLYWSFSFAMAWVSQKSMPAAIESCCLYRMWGGPQFVGDVDLAKARDGLLEALRQ
jgi:hypothetical protein